MEPTRNHCHQAGRKVRGIAHALATRVTIRRTQAESGRKGNTRDIL
jgi:hypothetical protein